MDFKLVLLWTIAANVGQTSASLYNPHLFPDKGPFFEGWYMRITDFHSKNSVGLLFGSVLPSAEGGISKPLVVVSILTRECDEALDICRLVSTDGEFDVNELKISVDGQPVKSDPDKTTPPNFVWQANRGLQGGYFAQRGGRTSFNFTIGDIILFGEATNPSLWNEEGTGPEGWLINLPLPLHWFVYSLNSRLIYCEIQNATSHAVTRVSSGAVHLEKNWGNSFPRKWIWSEGISFSNDNATFAMSGGLVDFKFLSVDAYLIGYRNPVKNISLNFRPDNSIITTHVNGCSGTASVSVNSLRYHVLIDIFTPEATLSSCLLGPEATGFERACVESYDASASIQVYERSFFPYGKHLIDNVKFKNIAFEFGGMNVCNDKCSNK